VANLSTPDQAVLTDTGVAYATLGGLLGGARLDASATTALALPAGTKGAAFQLTSGHHALVLWATAASGETASASYALTASGAYKAYAWDFSKTMASTTLTPAGGAISLALTSSPQIFVEQ
jgi:hypothetical protein